MSDNQDIGVRDLAVIGLLGPLGESSWAHEASKLAKIVFRAQGLY